jgi:hypothetical protein
VRQHAVPLFVAAAIILGFSALGGTGLAQTGSGPAPAASPSASPKPPSKFSVKLETYTSATNQQFVGPGTTPAEGPTFAQGGALAPGTPYDFFSGAPLVTGQGTSQDFLIKPTYAISDQYDITGTFGYGSASGTGNVINYWGDPLMPTINPTLGSRAFTLSPAFPTHNGLDPVDATRMSWLSGAILDHSGNAALTVGWFGMHQSVPWAFSQAPWTNSPFEVVPQLPQSIGDGPPQADVLKEGPEVLPLQGADLWYKDGLAMLEVAGGNLPSPSTSAAHFITGSAIVDHGDGLSYSAEFSGLNTTGPETARVLFGSGNTLVDGVPESTVYGQHMFVGGIGATVPVGGSDAELRYGYSCYSAVQGAAVATSTCTSGNYYYGKLHHGFAHFDVALEGVRFDASYAPAILDYGTIQNVLTYPAAFPGTYLRGDYQFVDNAEVGPNRQGGRLSTTFILAGVEVRLALAGYTQIQALDATSAYSAGFVEPYFLPQTVAHGTLGNEIHYEGWFNYHAKFADLTLDLSQVNTSRAAPAGSPGDNVSMSYPSAVFSLARPFGPKVTGAAGVGRFGLNGQFDTSGTDNASLYQDVVFGGVQLRTNANSGYGLEYRLYSVDGNPTLPGAPSPAFHGPQIQFYQRFKT